MFGARQVVVVGYTHDGAVYCAECAIKQRDDKGVNIHGADWFDLIQYSADEWAAESAYERAHEAGLNDYEIEAYDYPTCDECGKAVGA